MFAQLINTLKKSPKTIVFTEGTDPRILEASARLLSGNFLKPVLVGNPDEIAAAAEDIGFNIRGAEIIDPENYDGMDEMVDEMVTLRKGKMTADECRAALKKSNYFGTMLVKMGKADCLLGGATYSTADTVRPALQLIKTKPGNKIVSSCFIMVRPAASGANAPGGRFSGRLNIPAPQPRPFGRYCLLFGGEARLSRVHFYVGNARGPVSRFKRKPRRISADFFGEPHFKAFFFSAAAYNKGPLFAAF